MFDLNLIKQAINDGSLLGGGIARKAYALNDYVVVKKYRSEYSQDGQSENEIEFYNDYYDEFKDLMPEMYGYMYLDGELVLFVERVQCINCIIGDFINYEWEATRKQRKKILNRIVEFIKTTKVYDCSDNTQNWGITKDGRIVILDCGFIDHHQGYLSMEEAAQIEKL